MTDKPKPPPGKIGAALVIFAKAPIPGQVKTRLCPPLTPDEAATLQGTLVLDVVEKSRSVEKQMDRYLACAPSREHPFFKVMEGRHGLRLLDQVGMDIGARMAGVFEELFRAGHRPVVMVGTDVPAMPTGVLLEARNLLANHDVALGPAEDGGYFLIGLQKPAPELFKDIPWSTSEVRALTVKKAAALGLTVAELAKNRDLDRVEDLTALAQMAPTGKAKGQGGPISMRTAGVLKALVERIKERSEETP